MPKFKKIIILFLGLLVLFPNLARADESAGSTTSVTVPAHISDYDLSFAKTTTGTSFSQGDEISYELTYGALLSYDTTVTLQAQWYPGTVQSDSSSVDILDYVPGSATNAYGGVTPVIDTTNHTITWTINSFPGNTSGQVVDFKVKLNSNYTGSSDVDFNVAGRLFAPAVTFPDQIASATLKGIPTNNSGVGPSTTPTPTPIPTNTQTLPIIQGVDVRTITNNSASIYITTNQNSKISLNYGTSPNQLVQNQKTSSYSKSALISLSGLAPATIYYFQLTATNRNGVLVTSDVYSFTTSQAAPVIAIDTSSLVATSNDVILFSNVNQTTPAPNQQPQANILIIPTDTVFQITFALKNTSEVKKVQAVIRLKEAAAQLSQNNKDVKVLGASFIPEADAATDIVDLVETEPGVYTGKLKTTDLLGTYEIVAKIYDTKGNIIEQKISDLRVINKFTILSKKDNLPIEGARVYLYIYSESSKQYLAIPSTSLLSSNPVFTDRNGQLSITLPQGKYKASISNLRFEDQSVEFSIGPGESQSFPTVYLGAENLSVFKILRYYSQTLNDVFLYYTSAYAQVLTGSSRFFDLVSTVTLAGLVILTLFAFSKRHHIPLSSMASYFYYLIDHKNRDDRYIHGVVFDQKNKPIPSANVYIADAESEEIIERVKTSGKGEFFSKKGGKKYLIMVMARGYKTTPLLRYHERANLKFKVNLEKKDEGINLIQNAEKLVGAVIGMSFETIGILTLLLEILFINSFGLLHTAPFLAVSIFNIVLWTMYLHHHHSQAENDD